jgi:hypothetical protein
MRRCHECSAFYSPAKAGVQEREAIRFYRSSAAPLLGSGLGPGLRRGTALKQVNAFPLIMLLIVVLGMIYWFSGIRG